MNLIYMRHGTPKTRRFLKKKLRGAEQASIYDIEEGDCCLTPAAPARRDYIFTFLHDVTPDMMGFIVGGRGPKAPGRN